MLSKKKKIFIICGFCLLLAVTGILNIVLNNKATSEVDGNVVTSGNFFATYRVDREETRQQEILYLDAIIANASSSAEAKQTAETKKAEIVALMEKELVVEGLIKAKGFEDVVVSSTATAINVIVKSAELQAEEVAQIVEIIQSQTEYSLDNIKIIPVE